jgi:hypothetical protein
LALDLHLKLLHLTKNTHNPKLNINEGKKKHTHNEKSSQKTIERTSKKIARNKK